MATKAQERTDAERAQEAAVAALTPETRDASTHFYQPIELVGYVRKGIGPNYRTRYSVGIFADPQGNRYVGMVKQKLAPDVRASDTPRDTDWITKGGATLVPADAAEELADMLNRAAFIIQNGS